MCQILSCFIHTPSLTKKFQFNLILFAVVNFRVKYVSKEYTFVIIKYQLTQNTKQPQTGILFFDVTIKWDYTIHECYIFMMSYIKTVLSFFQYSAQKYYQYTIFDHTNKTWKLSNPNTS